MGKLSSHVGVSWLALSSGYFVIRSNWFKARYWEVVSGP